MKQNEKAILLMDISPLELIQIYSPNKIFSDNIWDMNFAKIPYSV